MEECGLSPAPDTFLRLDDIESAVRDRVVVRILSLEPKTNAILVTGSYAQGTADRYSDLDAMALTSAKPSGGHYTWFEPTLRGPFHISVGAREIGEWIARGTAPAAWSLGFPTREAAQYLYQADSLAQSRLGNSPVVLRPSSPPELEDFIEYIMKLRRAASGGYEVYVRWHARHAAELAPRLLIPLNPERRVRDPQDALNAALDLPICPEGYREDMLVSLGLESKDTGEIERRTFNLAINLLAFLRQHKPNIDSQPELTRYLLDGTLERYIVD
jgi:phosphoribosyl-AMP cyclohydrolase